MTEPTYSFTIPSICDDTALDCRLYHPSDFDRVLQEERAQLKGAVVAHPYAPLGGSYDDGTVLGITECLLGQHYIVLTFNFRGAGESAGKVSWTGRPELDDYASTVGLLFYYVKSLAATTENDVSFDIPSITALGDDLLRQTQSLNIQLLLAGYSFGSLILARLPSVSSIIQKFESADRGTAASETFLRARTLAKRTEQSLPKSARPQTPRSRSDVSPVNSLRGSPVVVGGEETSISERRSSRDARRSTEIMMEVPHQIKAHMKRHSRHQSSQENGKFALEGSPIFTRYLLVSPILVPLTTLLLSPGLPFTSGSLADEQDAGVLSLKSPSLIAFGTSDTFTSSKRLKEWSETLVQQSSGRVKWKEIADAGHFWHKKGAMRALQTEIVSWLHQS